MDGKNPEIQNEEGLKIKVVPVGEKPNGYISPMEFYNWPDFPEAKPINPLNYGKIVEAKQQEEQLKKSGEVPYIQGRPSLPLKISEDILKKDKLLPITQAIGNSALIYAGILGFHGAGEMKLSRREFLKLSSVSAILFSTGLFGKILDSLLVMSDSPGDDASYLYKTKAKISSARALILMNDMWQRFPAQRTSPILAVSQSKFDGLEPMVRLNLNIEELKKWLLNSVQLREGLLNGIKNAGSVESFFSGNYRLFYYDGNQEVDYSILDVDFLDAVKQSFKGKLPKVPPPGTVQA